MKRVLLTLALVAEAAIGRAAPPVDPDGAPSGAMVTEPGIFVADTVNRESDPVDWKRVVISPGSAAGWAAFELIWDTASAELTLQVFDERGRPIGPPPTANRAPRLRQVVFVAGRSSFLAKIEAKKGGSSYRFRCRFGDATAAPPATAEDGAPAPKPKAKPSRKHRRIEK